MGETVLKVLAETFQTVWGGMVPYGGLWLDIHEYNKHSSCPLQTGGGYCCYLTFKWLASTASFAPALAVHRAAAVDDLAGDIAGEVAGEEDGHVGDILRGASAAERNLLHPGVTHFL